MKAEKSYKKFIGFRVCEIPNLAEVFGKKVMVLRYHSRVTHECEYENFSVEEMAQKFYNCVFRSVDNMGVVFLDR